MHWEERRWWWWWLVNEQLLLLFTKHLWFFISCPFMRFVIVLLAIFDCLVQIWHAYDRLQLAAAAAAAAGMERGPPPSRHLCAVATTNYCKWDRRSDAHEHVDDNGTLWGMTWGPMADPTKWFHRTMCDWRSWPGTVVAAKSKSFDSTATLATARRTWHTPDLCSVPAGRSPWTMCTRPDRDNRN